MTEEGPVGPEFFGALMIYGHLSASETYEFLLSNSAWRFAFEWLKNLPEPPEPGFRSLDGDDVCVNVHGYETLPADQCRFESHRRYVDLQYCIRGGELIDWQRSDTLKPAGPFDEPKDLQFYEPGDSLTTVQMIPGSFAIFYPVDAHRPKRADGRNSSVDKLVIKIALERLRQ